MRTARDIVSHVCNEQRNSDLRADNKDVVSAIDAELAAKNQRIAELERCLGGPDIAECILQNREDERRKVSEDCASIVEDTEIVQYANAFCREDNAEKTLRNAAETIRSKYLKTVACLHQKFTKGTCDDCGADLRTTLQRQKIKAGQE